MAYNEHLAEKLRTALAHIDQVEEKKMFGGLAFLVNDKMCINVSGDRLMCRFDPEKIEEVSSKPGYEEMIMKGRTYKGYCYVDPEGFQNDKDFDYWISLSLSFNKKSKSSKKRK